MESNQVSLSNLRRKIIVLPSACLSVVGVLILMSFVAQSWPVQGVNKLNVAVQGSRPVAKAIQILERRCGCVITYEDPRYVNTSDLADVTLNVRRDLNDFKPGEAPKVLVPKSESLTIEYDDVPSARQPSGAAALVQQLLEAHSARGNAGRFRLETNGRLIHVIPTAIKNGAGELAPQESVLDTVITVPLEERSGMQTMQAICAAITQATGTQVVAGTVPLNVLFQHRDRRGGASEKARDALVSLLESLENGTSLSWQLLYDPGMKMYALNVYQVPRANSD